MCHFIIFIGAKSAYSGISVCHFLLPTVLNGWVELLVKKGQHYYKTKRYQPFVKRGYTEALDSRILLITWNEMALWYNFTAPPFHPWKLEMKFPEKKRVYQGNEKWKLDFKEKMWKIFSREWKMEIKFWGRMSKILPRKWKMEIKFPGKNVKEFMKGRGRLCKVWVARKHY